MKFPRKFLRYLIILNSFQVALIDPKEVGHAAAVILTLDSDTLKMHHEKTYIMSGPRSETGRSIFGYIKRHVGHDIVPEYASKELWDSMAPKKEPEYVKRSYYDRADFLWGGAGSVR